MMRILFVGQLWGICEQRKLVLEYLGHKVFAVGEKTWPLFSPKGFLYRVTNRMRFPLDVSNVNKKMVNVCKNHQFDLVWIDKGQTIYPGTLKSIKALMPHVPIVNFNPDDPFCPIQWGWGWFKKCIPIYDLCFVPRNVSVTEYKKAGAKFVKRFYWGYSPHLYKPMDVTSLDRKKLGGNVGFIGTFEKERAELIQSLADHGIPVRIWGENWEQRRRRSPNLNIEGKPLWGEKFTKALNSFDINLCFLNKLNRDTLNTRCFVIPACGAFMLAERTDDIMEHFEEGKEAEFFSTQEELIDKTHFYLQHDDLRRKIAAAGRERCVKSGYSNYERLRDLLKQVELKMKN